LHRLGSMEVPKGSSSNLPPLAPAVVDQLSASANVWALASHLYWGIWAIIQVECSDMRAVVCVPILLCVCHRIADVQLLCRSRVSLASALLWCGPRRVKG
jgi:hypothetical protein